MSNKIEELKQDQEEYQEKYDYIVYLLIHSNSNKTYIGITNNPERRIRMHNGEIKGGARYTTMNLNGGRWDYYGFILNLSKSMALSIEKRIHIHSRKSSGKTPLEKRINYINKLLSGDEYKDKNNDKNKNEYNENGLEFIIL